MSVVRLDLGRLLGFRIIVTGEGRDSLHSPKIGVKNCQVDADADEATTVQSSQAFGRRRGRGNNA